MKAITLACAILLICTSCKRVKRATDLPAGASPSDNVSVATPGPASTVVPPEKVAELKAANATLTQFVNSSGKIPNDLKEAVAQGALPKDFTAPPGMRIYYDPRVPTVGFVPAK